MIGFPITMDQPPRHQGPLPGAVDVVVIGGGIIGVMAAHYLGQAGQRVLLCEKGRIAGEQSGRNWGWIRQLGRDLAELPIMMDSLALWQELADQIGATALGFRQEGVLFLTRAPEELDRYADWAGRAAAFGLQTALWGREDVSRRLAGSSGDWVGGLYAASDARAEPWVALPRIADMVAATNPNVTLREGCAARGLLRKNGAVVGVMTEAGEVAASQVILAGGAWSSLFLGNEGLSIPQLGVRASVGASLPGPAPIAANTTDEDFAFRPRADGGMTLAGGALHDFYIGPKAFAELGSFLPVLRKEWRQTRFHLAAPRGFPDAWGTPRRWRLDRPGPFEAMRILDPAPNAGFLAGALRNFARRLPGHPVPRLAASWAGMIDTLPDHVPILDRAPGLPGLIVATGMAGHGFGIGPGFGKVLADLALGRPARHDLQAFRHGRFSDGSPRYQGSAL